MKQVLLVEDDEGVRRLLAELLEGEGYTVKTAANFDLAKEAMTAAPVDLLVADIVLPGGGSGCDLAEIAKAQGIKCLLVTGHPGWIEKRRVDVPCLIKPFKPAAFLEYIERIARC